MQVGSKTHLKRMGLVLVAILALVVIGRIVLTPGTFGRYGHYRAGAIDDELARPLVHETDASCKECHEWDASYHSKGKHKVVSCEFCHGPAATHVKDGKVIGHLEVQKGGDINRLCLRCHNKVVKARPHNEKVIKLVLYPDHLKKQEVEPDHLCNQCHLVHAPLEYIKMADKMFPMLKDKEGKNVQ